MPDTFEATMARIDSNLAEARRIREDGEVQQKVIDEWLDERRKRYRPAPTT